MAVVHDPVGDFQMLLLSYLDPSPEQSKDGIGAFILHAGVPLFFSRNATHSVELPNQLRMAITSDLLVISRLLIRGAKVLSILPTSLIDRC